MKDHGYYGNMARSHWKKLRPKMYRELYRKGLMDKALQNAQERTSDELADLLSKGVPEFQAEELILPRYVLLPAESDQPDLAESSQD